jgi:hypothetical protein
MDKNEYNLKMPKKNKKDPYYKELNENFIYNY